MTGGTVTLGSVAVSTGVKSAAVAFVPELVTSSGAETAVFVVALAAAVAGVAPVSALPGTDGPGGGASGCELAAIAAAAIASGAIGPPGAGAVAGALVVVGVDVGTATATGVGVVGALPTCCARMVASTTVASTSAPLDLWSSGFGVPGVVAVVVDWLVPLATAPLSLALAGVVAPEWSLDGDPLFATLLESSLAGGGVGALLLALLALLLALFAGVAVSVADGGASGPFCAGGGGGGAAVESFCVFWLTRFPKRSFAGGELERVSHDGAAWNAALAVAAASWVALSTGRSPARELAKQSARTGPFGFLANI